MENLIDRAAELNAKKKEIDTELNEIKAKLKSNGVGTFIGNKYKAVVTTRITRTLDQAKAVQVAKKLNAKWLLKEVVDEDVLEQSLASGEIEAKEFADCIISKSTQAISFKEVKHGQN